MRHLKLVLAAALPAAAACTDTNPAWLATETGPGTTDPGATSSGSTADPGTTGASTSTTTGEPTTGGTAPVTSEPGTTATTTTSGPDLTTTGTSSTTDAEGCTLAEGADLELTYSTTKPAGCDAFLPRAAHVEVLGPAGENTWKFNVCNVEADCLDPNAACVDGEHITLTFDSAPEFQPTFVPGSCHQVHLLARGEDPNNPGTCKLRVLRIADTRFAPYATHYVGAIQVPGNTVLKDSGEWLGLPGFALGSKLDEACADDPANCMPAPGTYLYDVAWGDPAVKHAVAEGASFEEHLSVTTPDQNQITIEGAFTNLRAHIHDTQMCGAEQDFKWVWLAQVPGP